MYSAHFDQLHTDTTSLPGIDFYELSNLKGDDEIDNATNLSFHDLTYPKLGNQISRTITDPHFTPFSSIQQTNLTAFPDASQAENLNPFVKRDEVVEGVTTSHVLNYPVASELDQSKKKYDNVGHFFLGVSVISAVLVIVFQSILLGGLNSIKDLIETDYTFKAIEAYLALFIFSSIYQILLSILALRTQNIMLLLFLLAFYCSMCIYTGIEYQEVGVLLADVEGITGWRHLVKGSILATLVVITVTFFIQTIMIVFSLSNLMKWTRFKKIGANFDIKRMYVLFQIHRCLLIFDFFFFLGFTIQFVIIILKTSSVEFGLTLTVIPITVLLLFIDDISVTREQYLGTFTALFLYLCGMAYSLFKLIRLYTSYLGGNYFPGRKCLTSYGVITIFLLIVTFFVELVVMYNFGRGLKPFISNYYRYVPGYREVGTRFDNESHKSDKVYSGDISAISSSNKASPDETLFID